MRTHIFIVNDSTFHYHLQYLFAGTGARDKDWHIGLLKDIKRVRAGDYVIFYIEANRRTKGGFYGIFKISDQRPLVFHTPGLEGKKPQKSKKLIFRTIIEPFEVYSEGVSEWEALDKLPIYATEVQWTLIYRKLKGQRGCTPILPWESEKLVDMIRNKNRGNPISCHNSNTGLDWDPNNRRIIITPKKQEYNLPRNYNYDLINEIDNKMKRKHSYEDYLQLFFTENILFDQRLSPIVGDNIFWFGNEVPCGVGMQKIDLLTINKINNHNEYRIIELKDEPIRPEIIYQIEYYTNWASQDLGRHLEGAFSWNIQPVIVAPTLSRRNQERVFSYFHIYNNRQISRPILYFEFIISPSRDTVIFNKINY